MAKAHSKAVERTSVGLGVSGLMASEAVARASWAASKGELLVILDFDRTITSNFMPDGRRVTSAHGILEDAAVLSEAFRSKAQELFRLLAA